MGTGLGLAIVYQIVRDHGGDIAVRSTPGLGTDVEVRIPLLVHTPVPA
jgi:signal transduction histidine kinase